MNALMRVSLLVVLGLVPACAPSCVPADATGCPLEPSEAVGVPCFDEGQQCGEFSLCDPCTSDLSECEMLECKDGSWTALEPDPNCEQ